jgi:hypothetical protein
MPAHLPAPVGNRSHPANAAGLVRAGGVLVLAGLGAGCAAPAVGPADLALAMEGAMPAVSPTAGPGTALPAPGEAAALYDAVCLAALPDFANVPERVASRPFTQNSGSGIIYHDMLNLSVELISADGVPACSMVFGTDTPPDQAVAAFETALPAATARQAEVLVNASPGPGTLTYINVFGTAPD